MLAGDTVVSQPGDDIFRLVPRNLSQGQDTGVKEIKIKAMELYRLIEKYSPSADKRCVALAKTTLEESVMWAVKAIT